MKIDLHCHTKRTKSGDPVTRKVDASSFASAIEAASVKIAAVTNHNVFDLAQYDEFCQAVGDNAMVWPGVELDVCGSRENSHWHLIVIANPKQKALFSGRIIDLTKDKSPDDVLVEVSEVFRAMAEVDAIYIAHAHRKEPIATWDDIKEMESLVEESWRLFFEPRDLVTVGIWSNHGYNMMLGSDVRDWGSYPGCDLPVLRLPVDSFEQFCLLAKRDGTTISTLLRNKRLFSITGHPHEGVSVNLSLQNDINVFFGQKGTGKTELLKSIEDALKADGCSCCHYYGNAKREEFKQLLSCASVARDTAEFAREDGSREITALTNWQEPKITPLLNYVEWWQTRANNNNKMRFVLADSGSLATVDSSSYETDETARDNFKSARSSLEKIEFKKYLDSEDATLLGEMLDRLSDRIAEELQVHYIDFKSVSLANKSLESIKSEIDAKSNTRSIPSSTGFIEFASARISLQETAARLLELLDPGELYEKNLLGTLDDKGDAFIVTRKRYLTTGSKTEEFDLKINDLRALKRSLEGIRDSALTETVGTTLADFAVKTKECGISDLTHFIGVKRYVSLKEHKEEYSPSSGEEGILLLAHALGREADYYILDEVELGMSNSYIDAVVRDRIQNLARLGKTVIIATHNANLAVRTLPYVTVYREHSNGDYRTYVGNPFTDCLVDIDGVQEPLSWSAKSLEVLEGSEEAFYARQHIYEAGTK